MTTKASFFLKRLIQKQQNYTTAAAAAIIIGIPTGLIISSSSSESDCNDSTKKKYEKLNDKNKTISYNYNTTTALNDHRRRKTNDNNNDNSFASSLSSLPFLLATSSLSTNNDDNNNVLEQQQQHSNDNDSREEKKEETKDDDTKNNVTNNNSNDNNVVDELYYNNLFPLRQLHKKGVDYPLWDNHWDGKHLILTEEEEDKRRIRDLRKNGVTRHIILIRHGQYDETHPEDERRILTELGREQAQYTGKRLAEMIQGFTTNDDDDNNSKFTPCNVKVLHVSNMTRAKETASIIAEQLDPSSFVSAEPDPLLNEGRPAHTIPPSNRRVSASSIQKYDEHHPRIEEAFQSYFYRHTPDEEQEPKADNTSSTVTTNETSSDGGSSTNTIQDTDNNNNTEDQNNNKKDTSLSSTDNKHEFTIIVCHANVIRYFVCRALQIPPEAWLRFCNFNCSLTYLTIRPGSGTVSLRSFGDTGHLPYNKTTFSKHCGFNW